MRQALMVCVVLGLFCVSPAFGAKLMGSFKFKGLSTYCQGKKIEDIPAGASEIEMMANVTIFKTKRKGDEPESLIPGRSFIEFSITREQTRLNCPDFHHNPQVQVAAHVAAYRACSVFAISE
jgi:hypothetical protein